jgi:CRP/FNR family cyclic AMP-dependent transcriptional regulator
MVARSAWEVRESSREDLNVPGQPAKEERLMKRTNHGNHTDHKNHANHTASRLGGFTSGADLGGKVSRYRDKQNIYTQGAPAGTLFYIEEGGVRLSSQSKEQPTAVTAILGAGDFFGEPCLTGHPNRMSTAVAMTASTIRTISKGKMLQNLRKKNKTSNSLVAYLVTSVKNYRDKVADLLTSSAEQRLARVLLQLAHLEKGGPASTEFPIVNHQVLAEMVGTTRPRVNLFMNQFRKQGFINYDGGLEVRQSLRKALRPAKNHR